MAGYGTKYGINQYGLEVDLVGPLVQAIDPTKNETDVSISTSITLETTDDDGVASLYVQVNRGAGYEDAFIQGETPAFKPGYDGPGSSVTAVSGGYRVVIDPTVNFTTGELIHVKVSATDPSGNSERLA